MLDKYRETHRKCCKIWRDNNRDRVNQRRRELRKEKKHIKMSNNKCLLCEISMLSKYGGCEKARLYCNNCTKNNYTAVSRHKWNRYYNSKKQTQKDILEQMDDINFQLYLQSLKPYEKMLVLQ